MGKFQIGMLIFPDMTNLDFAAPLEVFARMPNTEVHILAKDRSAIKTDVGSFVPPTMAIGEEPPLNLIFVGGGPGINALLEDEKILRFVAETGLKADWVTSVCTGALVLGAAGLLRGYKAATHWTAMEALRPFGAEPTDKRVVVDRNRITGGGVTAGMDFALTIVALLHGDAVAQSMQLAMEYDPEPPFQSGSPKIAPPAIVERVRAGAAALTADRIAIAERVARKNGWPSEP
jgi:cyclohexyl-isocyanide hydratase